LDVAQGPSIKTADDVTSDDLFGLRETFVLDIQVSELIRGRQQQLTDGHVYVEVPRGANTEKALDSVLPESKVLLFLADLKGTRSHGLLNASAGRPPGARHFAPWPQGFIFARGDGSILGVEDLGDMPDAWSRETNFDELVRSIRR
jgi:hypothetical protein